MIDLISWCASFIFSTNGCLGMIYTSPVFWCKDFHLFVKPITLETTAPSIQTLPALNVCDSIDMVDSFANTHSLFAEGEQQ